MAVTLSAAVLLGLATFIILRGRYVGFGSALVLFLFGFFTAGTGAAGPITRLCAAVVRSLANIT